MKQELVFMEFVHENGDRKEYFVGENKDAILSDRLMEVFRFKSYRIIPEKEIRTLNFSKLLDKAILAVTSGRFKSYLIGN